MIKFCPLFSGSSGNALYLKYNDTSILIDAGLSKKRITQAISDIGEDASKLNAILITHEHIDHIKGIGYLERGYDIPIYANSLTWGTMPSFVGKIREDNKKTFEY
jgi:phosphoribosyl 1,2-cyclic phosphodiesterase